MSHIGVNNICNPKHKRIGDFIMATFAEDVINDITSLLKTNSKDQGLESKFGVQGFQDSAQVVVKKTPLMLFKMVGQEVIRVEIKAKGRTTNFKFKIPAYFDDGDRIKAIHDNLQVINFLLKGMK